MFAKRAERHDREASFPYDDFADLREAGFLALCVPVAWGGLGASFADYCRVSQRARPARARDRARLQHALRHDAARRPDRRRPDVDRRRTRRARCPPAASCTRASSTAGVLHSQPFSEGNAPRRDRGHRDPAEPVDGGYLVSGRKIFASLSEAANVHNIVAKVPGDDRVRFLGVPAVSRWAHDRGGVGPARHAGHVEPHVGLRTCLRSRSSTNGCRPADSIRRRRAGRISS